MPETPATSGSATSDPVTADDVAYAVRLGVTALHGADTSRWDAKSRSSLEWTCWETVEHLADDLFSYAAQLGPQSPPSDTHVPFVWSRKQPGGPANVIFADRAAGPAGLLQVLEACGTLLTAVVRTTSCGRTVAPRLRPGRPGGLRRDGRRRDAGAPARRHRGTRPRLGARRRPLWPGADQALPGRTDRHPRWPTLLWATGRAELPGHPRLTSWRWYGAPAGERQR